MSKEEIISKLMNEHEMTEEQANETIELMQNVIKAVYDVIVEAWKYVKEVTANVIEYLESETGMTIAELLEREH